MKAVILAGGRGTRLHEETNVKPKPLVSIGGKPILWHIMKCYAAYGINDFIICLGYKGELIKEFFINYSLHMSNVTVDLKHNQIEFHRSSQEDWRVTLIDTGEETNTGGRLKRVSPWLNNEDFCFTYGDGVGDIDISAVVTKHQEERRLATVTAVQPKGRFGTVEIENDRVVEFREKTNVESVWVNAGFFVLSPSVIEYIEGDHTSWEEESLQHLTKDKQLTAYYHRGYWQAMDTLREKDLLEKLWQTGNAPWKVWD